MLVVGTSTPGTGVISGTGRRKYPLGYEEESSSLEEEVILFDGELSGEDRSSGSHGQSFSSVR